MMKAVSLNRVNQILLLGILVVVVLYYARQVLIPLVFAAMLAMLMTPVCRRLDRLGMKRWLSVLVCILILLVVLAGAGVLVGAQFNRISQDFPQMQQKSDQLLEQLQSWVQDQFGVSPQHQVDLIRKQIRTLGQSAGGVLTKMLTGFTGLIAGLLLTLVYTFLMLYHKEKYEIFLLRLYGGEDTERTRKVIHAIRRVAQQYLTGRLISIVILTVLYSIGLLIIGIQNAILLAGVAALLTVVPYVGPLIGGLFPVMMALVTEDSLQPALLVAIMLVVVQAIDNYFIEPYVIGGEVNLSAIATIAIIVIGGFIWGIAGMVLFIPLLGILKIIFDHVDGLQPYAYLIGDPASDASGDSSGGKAGKEESGGKMKNWLKKKLD